MKNSLKKLMMVALYSTLALSVSACSGAKDRLANIGKVPEFTKIEAPQVKAGYEPISLPMPKIEEPIQKANALWSVNRQAFFKDQRAHAIGDILTVVIDIKDKADIENETVRTRTNSENAGVPNVLGLESYLGKFLPDSVSPTNLVGATSDTNSTGNGTIKRDEEISMKIAAMITEVLPNGNFIIYGRQEVRVNYEVRELAVTGVIRPEDVSTENAISYDQIAEARVSYGGRGHISDIQQPRYGQQVLDVILPF